eukprot:1184291-Prymnesium_polylepis.1
MRLRLAGRQRCGRPPSLWGGTRRERLESPPLARALSRAKVGVQLQLVVACKLANRAHDAGPEAGEVVAEQHAARPHQRPPRREVVHDHRIL